MKEYNPFNGILVSQRELGMSGMASQGSNQPPVPIKQPAMTDAQHEALAMAGALVDRLGRISLKLHSCGEEKIPDSPGEPSPSFSMMPRAIQEKLKNCHALVAQIEQTLFGS